MRRSLELRLNRVAATPAGLRDVPAVDAPAATTTIQIERLAHVYYLDNYEPVDHTDDSRTFAHLKSLIGPSEPLRFRGTGPGRTVDARREEGRRLGQAMCRLLLHDHFSIRYFTHVSAILDGTIKQGLTGFRLRRTQKGDTPDYLCAESVTKLRLAEAKARKTAISFGTKEFQLWRDQFSRVALQDPTGVDVAAKGFVVGLRLVDDSQPRSVSRVYIEDPTTPGETRSDGDNRQFPTVTPVVGHYAQVCDALGQDLVAYCLRQEQLLARDHQIEAQVFRPLSGPLAGKRFVGVIAEEIYWLRPYWARLRREETFFGLEEGLFGLLCKAARVGREPLNGIEPMLLREPTSRWDQLVPVGAFEDGTVSGPLSFFGPEGQARF